MKSSKKWIFVFLFIVLFGGLIPYLFSYYYLSQIYENKTFKEIVERQVQNDSIYGTAFNQNMFGYKLELIRKIRPDVIALGSSRVMQFRSKSFTKSFINAGGAMNEINEGIRFYDEIKKIYTPKMVILGLDFWWVSQKYPNASQYPYHKILGDEMKPEKIYTPLWYLISGKVNLDTLQYVLDNTMMTNTITEHDSLGYLAISSGDGFMSDGSYLYSKILYGIQKNNDHKFSDTLRRIQGGFGKFEHGENALTDRLLAIKEFIASMKRDGVEVVVFIPPLADTVLEEMQNYNYKYIEEFLDYSKNLGAYNYHSISHLSQDCEFIDGFHGGDITYQNILFDIAKQESSLRNVLDIKKIEENIRKYKGMAIGEGLSSRYKEVDFLGLGCKK